MPSPDNTAFARHLRKIMGSCLLGSSFLCLASAQAFAVEPWIMVEKYTFTDDPIKYRGQGVTTDGTNWYFSGTNALEMTDGNFDPKLRLSPGIPPELFNPSPMAPKGLNHIGDIDYADGYLYISLDTSKKDPGTGAQYNTPVFAIYRASDMTFTGKAFSLNPPHGTHDIASWVAVDARKGEGYGMSYDNSTEIAVYNLEDWSFKKYIKLSRTIDQAQGGKILNGWMYFSTENATKSIYRANLETGEVEEIGHLVTPGEQEVEGLSFGWTKDGWSLFVLNREQLTPEEEEAVGFYRYLRPYGNALSGEIHASVKGAFIEDSRFLQGAASERLRSAFAATDNTVMAFAAYGQTGGQKDAGRPTFWAQALTSNGKASGSGYAADFDHTTDGFLIGADAPLGAFRLGLLAGYSSTDFDVDERFSSGTSDNLYFGAYGGTQWGALGLRAGVIYGRHSIDTKRDVVFPAFSEKLTASYDADTAQVFGELGYRIDLDPVVFEPFANLSYVHLSTDGFAEKGGMTAALRSKADTWDTTSTTLGLRAAAGFDIADTQVTLRGMLGWQHALGEVTPDASFKLNNGSDFDIEGAPIAKDTLNVEAGFDLALSSEATLGASYAGQFAEDTEGHTFKVTLGFTPD